MKLSRGVVEFLKGQFVSRYTKSTIGGHITPNVNDQINLGSASYRFNEIRCADIYADNLHGSVEGDADTVDTLHAAATPTASTLLALDASSKFPVSTIDYSGISTPDTIEPDDTANAGSSNVPARSDHQHAIACALPGQIEPDDAALEGSATSFARSDHQHSIVTSAPGTIQPDQSASEGTSTDFARADHQHAITCGNPNVIYPDDTQSEGIAATFARTDHQHGILTDPPGVNLSASTSNSEGVSSAFSRADHLHAITTSYNPSSEVILRADSSGFLSLKSLGIGIYPPSVDVHIQTDSSVHIRTAYNPTNYTDIVTNAAGIFKINPTSHILRLIYNSTDYGEFEVTSSGGLTIRTVTSAAGGLLTLQPEGDIILDPDGFDVLPDAGYEINLGSLQKKYLTLHAAELWVETLVAQDTIATIGGRILVGPTTSFTRDLGAATYTTEIIDNNSFETAGGGGGDVFADWVESTTQGVITQESSNPYHGTYYAKMQESSGEAYMFQLNTLSSTDRKFRLRFYTQGDGTNAGQFRVSDGNNNDMVAKKSTGVTAASWTMVEEIFDWVYVNHTSIKVWFYSPSATSGYAYFDLVSLWEVSDIYVKHNEMADGDIAYAEANGSVEFVEILTGPTLQGEGDYLYVAERDLDQSVSNNWYAGDALFNTGTVDEGFIDLYSIHGIKSGTEYGPTIVGNLRNSSTYNDWTVHWAIGNLNGLYDYGADTMGFAAGRYSSTTAWLSADETAGIRIMRGSTPKIQLQADGDVFIGEDAGAAADTFLAIFTNAQMYNSESMAAGDVLVGDNSPNKANILWDKDQGQLKFRGGTSAEAYIDTDGSITAEGGNVVINSTGINLFGSGGGAGSRVITFYDNSSGNKRVGKIYGDWAGGGSDVPALWMMAERNTGDPWTEEPVVVLLAIDAADEPDQSLRFDINLSTEKFIFSHTNVSNPKIDFSNIPVTNLDAEGIDLIGTNHLRMPNNIQIQQKDPGGTYRSIIFLDSSDILYIGESGGGQEIRMRPGGTTALTIATDGDVYTKDWTSYSPTITGAASMDQNIIYWKRIGKLLFLNVYLEGTKNGTTGDLKFPLPDSLYSTTTTYHQNTGLRAQDDTNGWGSGFISVASNSTEVRMFRTPAGDGFTANDGFFSIGQIWLEVQ